MMRTTIPDRRRDWLSGASRLLGWWSRVPVVQMLAAGFLLTILLGALLAPLIAPFDPNRQAIFDRLLPPFLLGGSPEHLLGTDELGRDVLSRILYGAQTSMMISISVVLLTMVVGTVLGALAGWIGGWFDTALMWVCDVVLSLPGLLLSAVLVFVLGPDVLTVVIALSIEGWLVYCRQVRSMVMSIRKTTYIEAARTIGTPVPMILLRHVLPNLAAPVVTIAALELARIILAEASLSFLGLGIQPPMVSWGLMINGGGGYMTTAWWLITLPGLALTLTVLSSHVVADWLRDLTDPLHRNGARR